MYIQNSNALSYSAFDDKTASLQNKQETALVENRSAPSSASVSLEHFSEKAVLIFASLTSELTPQQKEAAAQALSSIGKAAAFASANGFESQRERTLVNQYFGNFEGVLSDDAIKKMIYSKLDNPNFENRAFLKKFASALDEPLKSINIRV